MVMPARGDETTISGAAAEPTEELRSTVVAAPSAASPELSDRPRRRVFPAKEKLRILDALDRVAGVPGATGALLRREGVYSSSVSDWGRQRAAGAYEALSPAARGPKPAEPNLLTAENAQLIRENKRLKQRLERAEAVIEIQKKVAILLNLPAPNDEKS
jgi:transposase-like protein